MHNTALPGWLFTQAAVEKARYGHITERTIHLINRRMAAYNRSHPPPLTQNLGRLIQEQLRTQAVRLRDQIDHASTRTARHNAQCKALRFRGAAVRLGLAA